MSMRYFTLSAVCMLIFCMLLALSGTTDFPAVHDEIVSPAGIRAPIPEPTQSTTGEAVAAVVRLPQDPEPTTDTGDATQAIGGTARNRPLLLLGIALVAGWILLSFRLYSSAKR